MVSKDQQCQQIACGTTTVPHPQTTEIVAQPQCHIYTNCTDIGIKVL